MTSRKRLFYRLLATIGALLPLKECRETAFVNQRLNSDGYLGRQMSFSCHWS